MRSRERERERRTLVGDEVREGGSQAGTPGKDF